MSKRTAARPKHPPTAGRSASKSTPPRRARTMGRKSRLPSAAPANRGPDFHPKAKVSIAIDSADLEWMASYARTTNVSVSTAFAEAVDMLKRHYDLGKLLELMGGADDIAEADMKRVEAEFREAGLIP